MGFKGSRAYRAAGDPGRAFGLNPGSELADVFFKRCWSKLVTLYIDHLRCVLRDLDREGRKPHSHADIQQFRFSFPLS